MDNIIKSVFYHKKERGKMEKTYRLSIIKKAFWGNFHEEGELFSRYWETNQKNIDKDTEDKWEWFLEELEKANDRS